MGWGQRLRLEWDAVRRAHRVERQLLPGRYQYKLIFDDRWSYDLEHPTLQVRCTGVARPIAHLLLGAACYCTMTCNALTCRSLRPGHERRLPATLSPQALHGHPYICALQVDGGSNTNNYLDVPRQDTSSPPDCRYAYFIDRLPTAPWCCILRQFIHLYRNSAHAAACSRCAMLSI